MPVSRRIAAGVALIAASALFAACSPSVSPKYDGSDPFAEPIVPQHPSSSAADIPQSGTLGGPEPRTGSGTLTVATPADTTVPAELADAFHSDTGFTLAIETVSSTDELASIHADVLFGFDASGLVEASGQGALGAAVEGIASAEGTGLASVPQAVAYGRDDVCVLVDRSWASATRASVGTGFQAIPSIAGLLAVPDPESSMTGRTLLLGAASAIGADISQWSRSLASGGALVSSEEGADSAWTLSAVGRDAESGAQAGDMPFLVAPMSTIARVTTTPGAESYAEAVGGTCTMRYLYAAPASSGDCEDGVQSFLAWLLTWHGQRTIASQGTAYPLDGSAADGTPAGWFMTPHGDAVSVAEELSSSPADLLAQWSSAVRGHG